MASQTEKDDKEKLDMLCLQLPAFCRDYFKARSMRLSVKSMISYAYDFLLFFRFLQEENPRFKNTSVDAFRVDDLELLSVSDIEEFMYWQRKTCEKNTSIYRRLSSLSALYTFLQKRDYLTKNPVALIERETKKKKEIIKLEVDETISLKHSLKTGYGFTDKEVEKNKHLKRDYAMFSLLLNEGLRVSEMVGINLTDLDLPEKNVGIIRKGGDYQKIYLSDQSVHAIEDYLAVRNEDLTEETKNEEALFLSQKHGRISTRNVEILLKKYMRISNPSKADIISPHKLRSTFATDFYRENPDILTLQRKMGHKNIQTTTIYADVSENKMRETRNIIEDARNHDTNA